MEKEGFEIEQSEKINQTFGESTADAVVGFQQKYKEEILNSYNLKYGTGFVGKSTRAKLNLLYGCGIIQPIPTPVPVPTPIPTPTSTISSIPKVDLKVNGSNGPSTVKVGDTITLTWNSENVSYCLGEGFNFTGQNYGSWFDVKKPPSGTEIFTSFPYYINARIGIVCMTTSGQFNRDNVYVTGIKETSPTSTIPSITVLSPNGGEIIGNGDFYAINFKLSDIVGMVDILLMKGNNIQSNIGSVGFLGTFNTNTSYTWVVKQQLIGSLLPEGNDYKIRIRRNQDFNVYDDSDLPFAIKTVTAIQSTTTSTQTINTTVPTSSNSYVMVTSPNGGETLVKNSIYKIKWNSSNVIDKISLGYSFGAGSLNWIATNISNIGYYDWTVNIGNTTNTQAKIYIIGYQTGVGSWSDYSDNYFTVALGSFF